MSRDANGNYTPPDGTTAIPGAVITDDEFNNFVQDISTEITAGATVAQVADLGAAPSTAGTGKAYTLTMGRPIAAPSDGLIVGFKPHIANTGACTLSVNS